MTSASLSIHLAATYLPSPLGFAARIPSQTVSKSTSLTIDHLGIEPPNRLSKLHIMVDFYTTAGLGYSGPFKRFSPKCVCIQGLGGPTKCNTQAQLYTCNRLGSTRSLPLAICILGCLGICVIYSSNHRRTIIVRLVRWVNAFIPGKTMKYLEQKNMFEYR